ncbi:GntR family transcriptional regulator [Algiphilus sp.]|uniref:GntR family transcriptional regulator n=1 Tax=Algiphilus sp. TaxID=1872431 RepID=UPI0032EE8070
MPHSPLKRSSSQAVYERLRHMILEFELYPGSRVTETELAERFKVSRTPVREALQHLEADGYLTIRPKQGCFIRELDIHRLAQFYDVRVALELRGLEHVCTYAKSTALEQLAAAWDPEVQQGRSTLSETMASRDEAFHVQLVELGGNPVLAQYLRDVNNHIRIVRRLDFTQNMRIDATYQEHYAICQALLRRDLTTAKELMVRHIQRSEDFARTLTLTELAQKRIQAAAGRPPSLRDAD